MNKIERCNAFLEGKRVFRVRDIATGAWWEDIAKDKNEAATRACKENAIFDVHNLDIREYTANGGWSKK